MTSSLVGSEMCIRDSPHAVAVLRYLHQNAWIKHSCADGRRVTTRRGVKPVSYTHLTLPTICSV
eukprot:4716041-Prorocentrum_lima.AAC.1